jgi:hypothetical protein
MADRGGSDKPSLRRRTGGSASRGHGCGSSSPAYSNKNESPHRAGKIGEGCLQVDGMRLRMPSVSRQGPVGAVKQRRRVPASSYYGQFTQIVCPVSYWWHLRGREVWPHISTALAASPTVIPGVPPEEHPFQYNSLPNRGPVATVMQTAVV